jgi:uncharacterized membrane protein
MRKFTIFLATLVLSTFTVLAQPKIEIIGGDVYDWGDVKLSEGPLKATIKIKNTGDKELIIQNVKPSCGCTTAPLDKDRLKPGETANLDVTLKVSSGGKTSKSIRIASNDPAVPNKNLTISANVIEMLKIEPTSYIRFTELQVGKESMATVSLFNNDKIPMKIKRTSHEPSFMIVSFVSGKGEVSSNEAVIPPGQKIDIKVKVTPQTSGYYKCNIKLSSDHPDHKLIEINGYGSVAESPIFNAK